MKKQRLLLFLITLSLTYFSCSNEKDWKNPEVIEQEFNDNLRGTYEISLKIEKDTTKEENEFAQVGKDFAYGLMGLFKFKMTFLDEGKYEMNILGETAEGEWKMSGNKLEIKGENQDDFREYELVSFDGKLDSFVMNLGEGDEIEGFLFTKLDNNKK